mmetsp:Transcript_26662/g.92630  ORF Transcript_26662/g.92630 Transcript_26662/m.92630 type:complete len:96 (-) Transcript_26662:252-539(-)
MAKDEPTEKELEIGRRVGASEDVVHCIKHVFCTFDTDASGSLDLSELARLTEELGEKLDDDEVRLAMKELDVNGDGTIGFAEFAEWWMSMEEEEE